MTTYESRVPDQLDVDCAIATNKIRRSYQQAQARLHIPVTPLPIRLPDGTDAWDGLIIKEVADRGDRQDHG